MLCVIAANIENYFAANLAVFYKFKQQRALTILPPAELYIFRVVIIIRRITGWNFCKFGPLNNLV